MAMNGALQERDRANARIVAAGDQKILPLAAWRY